MIQVLISRVTGHVDSANVTAGRCLINAPPAYSCARIPARHTGWQVESEKAHPAPLFETEHTINPSRPKISHNRCDSTPWNTPQNVPLPLEVDVAK